MRVWLQAHRVDLIALAGLGLLALIFFWPVTLNVAHIPRGGGDLASFLWPIYSYTAQSLWSGRVPLWNPTLYAGMPFLADNQTAVFYPVNLLAYLITPGFPYRAIEWLVVMHVWLAGAGMYALMRVLPDTPMHRLAALLPAVAFMFSDVFITHIGNLNIIAVAAWLPWAFAALHRALSGRSVNAALVAGGLLGVAALAGHAQTLLMSAGALGAFGAFHLARAAFARDWSSALRTALLLALTFLIAFGLSALTILPAAELTQHTARARLEYVQTTDYSLPWAGLAGLASPLIFGRGAVDFWGPWARVELGYLGVLPLALAGLAPFRHRSGVPLFMALLAVFAVLVALGGNTPLHRALYDLVPGFAQLRVPARFILLTDFALAALAGFGLQRVLSDEVTQAWRWMAAFGGLSSAGVWMAYRSVDVEMRHAANVWLGVGIFVALLAAAWLLITLRSLRKYTAALAVLVVAIDLIAHGAWVEVDWDDPVRGFEHPQAVEFLRAQGGPTRMDVDTGAWAPDAAAVWGLEDIGGVSNPLGLARYQTYVGSMGSRGSPRYDFLGAQWIIAEKDRPPAADPDIVPVFNEDANVDVWLNTAAMPRINLMYAATVVLDGDAAFAAILAPGFDPRATVVIEADPPALNATNTGASNLFYASYAPEAYTIIAQTTSPAYLVLSEVWYPGWRAWVDGVEVPIHRANFAFRAVALTEPGEHRVEMRFEPLSWQAGLTITLLMVMALLGWTGWIGWKRR